jgi:hypothetical protein
MTKVIPYYFDFLGGIIKVVTIDKISIALVIIGVGQLFVLVYCRFFFVKKIDPLVIKIRFIF